MILNLANTIIYSGLTTHQTDSQIHNTQMRRGEQEKRQT